MKKTKFYSYKDSIIQNKKDIKEYIISQLMNNIPNPPLYEELISKNILPGDHFF